MVARELACNGIESVRSVRITLFKPIRPMLAERASSIEEGLTRMEGEAGAEYKLDGERVQIHKGTANRRHKNKIDISVEDGTKVELFSRRLENITSHYPDVVEAIRNMRNLKEVILEGEIVAVDPSTSEYLPFQELMHRRRKYGVEEAMQSYPVVVNIFDVLYNEGKSVTSYPYEKRRRILGELVEIGDFRDSIGTSKYRTSSNTRDKRRDKKSGNNGEFGTGGEAASHGFETRVTEKKKKKDSIKIQEKALLQHRDDLRSADRRVADSAQSSSKDTNTNRIQLITQIMSSDEKEIQGFMDSAIDAGCEGIMLKHRESVYRAGSREYLWIKVKREYRSELADTLDLVIIGALYGRGRRAGKYGALLVGVYDEDQDLFRSVSKVGTGFTDQHLESFYNSLESLRIGHKSPRVDTRMEQMDVWFEPKIVIEVIASEITLSPAHTAGLNSIRDGYGLALRFPKFTGKIRDDKSPEDATSVHELIEIFKQQLKRQTKK